MAVVVRTVSLETRVNTYTAGDQDYPSVAKLDGGGYVVTWQSSSQDSGTYGVYAQRYNAAGQPLGSEFRVNTTSDYAQSRQSVTGVDGGGFVVSWVSYNGTSPTGVFAQRYAADGTPQGSEFRVNVDPVAQAPETSITRLASGGFVVTWIGNSDGDGFGIYARIYNAAGVAQTGDVRINQTTAGGQICPSVSPLADGSFVVTWASSGQDGAAYGIYATRVSATGVVGDDGNSATIDGEFRVNTTTAGNQEWPRIATLADGSFVVVWNSDEQDGSGWGVYGQRYSANGVALGSEFRVNIFTNDDQGGSSGIGTDNGGRSSITALADGGFVVAWQSQNQNGSPYDIYAQRYFADGTVNGAEFRVNGAPEHYQLLPSVAGLDDGSIVFTWMSTFGQDGSSSGVYQRIYSAGTALTTSVDTVEGLTTGDDIIFALNNGLSAGDVIDGLGGTDTIRLSEAGTLDARNGTLTSIERFEGSTGNDTIYGTSGHDTLDGRGGADAMIGQAGNDTYIVDDAGDTVTEDADASTDEVRASVSFTLGANIEALVLTGVENINATGNAGANTLTGNSGNNILNGGSGNDTLNGGGGVDSFRGDDGDDTIIVNGTSDLLLQSSDISPESYDGGAGTDTLEISDSTDFTAGAGIGIMLFTRIEQFRFAGSTSTTATFNIHGGAMHSPPTIVIGNGYANHLVWTAVSQIVSGADFTFTFWTARVDTFTINGTSDGDELTAASIGTILNGNAGNDTLTGGVGADTLNGGHGYDILTGNGGADSMNGGANHDYYYADASDTITESAGEGTDTVYIAASYTLAANVEILRLQGTANYLGIGNSTANNLYGNVGNNRLDGKAGADRMFGGAGNDIYVVDNIGDRVLEAAGGGADLVQSSITFSLANLVNVENLTLTGSGAINATGNAERNLVTGNSGANILDGKLGADTLTGGAGADQFRFTTALAFTNIDRITDFTTRSDKIVLENAVMTKLSAAGAFNAANFVLGTAALDAADRLIYDKGTGRLYYDADGFGTGAKVQVLSLFPGTTLNAGDILVI